MSQGLIWTGFEVKDLTWDMMSEMTFSVLILCFQFSF